MKSPDPISALSKYSRHRGILLLMIGVALLSLSVLSHAQSCALCYTQAASSGSRLIRGLRSGIVILIIPPALMSIGITALAYKKRNQFNNTAKDSRPSDW